MNNVVGKFKGGFQAVKEFDYKKLLLDPWPFLAAWTIMAIVTITVPVVRWKKLRENYYNYYGYAIEYEQQQKAYENANNDQNDNNNQQWNYNNNCSWWNWACRKKAYNYNYRNNNDDKDDQVQVPDWYVWIGGKTEEDRREREEEGGGNFTTGALKFVFVWTLLIFLGLVFYGAFLIAKQQDLKPLRFGLFIFLNFAVLSLVLIGQGVISTEERELEESVYGWYGQLGVLMVYSDFWYILFSFFGLIALNLRIAWMDKQNKNNNSSSYNRSAYSQPKATYKPQPTYTQHQEATTNYTQMPNKSSSDEENGAF